MALRYENGQYVLDGVKKAGTQSASDRLSFQQKREEAQKNQQTTTKPVTQQNTTTAPKKQGGFLYDAISRLVGDAEFEVRARVLANQEAEKEFPVLNNTLGKRETEAAIAANQDIITSFDSKWQEINQNGMLSPEQKQAAVSDLYKQVRDAEEAIYNAQTAERELEAAKKAQDQERQSYADAVYKGLVKERFESVKDSEDFETYRQRGANTDTNANIVKWMQSVNAPGTAAEKQYYLDLYRFLTEEELGVYEYYVGKDAVRADWYMTNVLEPLLQERQAQSKADAVNDMEGVGKTLATMLVGGEAGYYNFLTGLVGVAESIGNALGYETEPYQPVLELTYQKVIQDAGGVDKLLGELAYNIGSNAPAMFTGQVSSGLGRAMFGGSVYGNSYREAKEAGVEEAVAHLYSALNTAAELGLETVLGGIPGVSGKNGLASKIGKSIQKVTDGFVKNPTIARLIYTGAKMASGGMGEGVEEYLQSIINPALQNFLLGAENEIQLLSQESMDSALVGLLMGIVMNGMAGGNLTTGQRKALSQREAEYLTKQYEDIVQQIGADSPKAAQAYEDMMDALTANAVLEMEATAADVISASQNDGMNTDSIVQDNGMRAAILNPENTAELYQYFGKDTTRAMIEAAKAYESPASVAQRIGNAMQSAKNWISDRRQTQQTTTGSEWIKEEDFDAYMNAGDRGKSKSRKRKQYEKYGSALLDTKEKRDAFIKQSQIDGNKDTRIAVFGKVGEKLSQAVFEMSDGDVDVSDKYLELDSNHLYHTRHFSLEEKLKIPEWIMNCDDVLRVRKKNGDTKIYLGKKINGHSVIVELLSTSRASLIPLTVLNMSTEEYKSRYGQRIPVNENNGGYRQATASNETMPFTPEALAPSTIDTETITQNETSVNSGISDKTENDQTAKATEAENKIIRNVAENETVDPTGSGQQRYISQTAQRLVSADYVPSNVGAELIDEIRNGTFTYEVSTDADAEKSALDKIARNGVQGAVSIFSNAVENGNAGKADIALGEVLLRQALQARDVETSMQLIADLAIAGRQAGQSLQAMTMLNKLTPDGRLYTLEKMVMHMQEDLDRNRGSKAPTLRISPELAEKLLFAEDTEAADIAEDDIVKDIAKQIPATLAEKWNAWRYLAMLGNPRTHFRNIIGNATFIPIRNLKNVIKTGLESLDVKRGKMQQSERTASITTDKASRDYARADFENVKDIASGAGKYNDAKSRVNDARKIFDSKILEKPRNWNGTWLEGEDIFFLKRAYANSFAQAMKARGITVDQLKDGTPGAQRKLNSLREYAIREAQKATFREASAVADALNRMKKMPGIGAVLEGVLPFTKTPINITKRSLEYSPVGLFKSFYDLARNTKRTTTDRRYKTREQALDEMASGLTGTGVLLLGLLARALGIVNGKEEDENKASYMNMLGLQNYSINVGDSTYTLNWLAPASIPFFTGVNLFDAIEGDYDGMSAVEVVSNFATPALDPLLEMSMLQGVNDLIDNVRFEDSSIPAVLINSATGYVSQGVPTLFGALARTFDDTRRSKYTDKTTGIPAGAQKFMQNVQAKIPGLENMLNEYVDFWGRTEEEKNILVRAFENLVSPGYISNKNTSDVDVELLRLYDATGEAGVLPDYAPKYFNVDGKRVDLTAEQYVKFQKERGTLAFDLMDEMVHSEDYERLTDIEKAEAAEMVLDYANDVAQTKVSDYKLVGTNGKIHSSANNGISPVYSIISRVMTGTAADAAGKKNLTNAEIVEALGGKSSPETIISNLNKTAQQKYEKAKRMDISSKQFVDAVVAMSEYDSKSNQLSALKSIGLTSKKAFSLYYVMSGNTETPAVKVGRQKAIDSGISETKFYDMYMALGGTKRGKQESYDILRQSGFSSADAKTFLLSMWDYKKTGYEE